MTSTPACGNPTVIMRSLSKYCLRFNIHQSSMNQRIGYARASTDVQSLELQREALEKAGCSTVFAEIASGKLTERPELERCGQSLRPGDTLVVWRLDRLGRSLSDLIQMVVALERRGVAVESLDERIQTGGAAGRRAFHVFAALAEFERNLLRERSQAGVAAARARGRSGGRKPKLDAQQVLEIQRLMSDPTIPVRTIAEKYNVSRATVYKVAPARKISRT